MSGGLIRLYFVGGCRIIMSCSVINWNWWFWLVSSCCIGFIFIIRILNLYNWISSRNDINLAFSCRIILLICDNTFRIRFYIFVFNWSSGIVFLRFINNHNIIMIRGIWSFIVWVSVTIYHRGHYFLISLCIFIRSFLRLWISCIGILCLYCFIWLWDFYIFNIYYLSCGVTISILLSNHFLRNCIGFLFMRGWSLLLSIRWCGIIWGVLFSKLISCWDLFRSCISKLVLYWVIYLHFSFTNVLGWWLGLLWLSLLIFQWWFNCLEWKKLCFVLHYKIF